MADSLNTSPSSIEQASAARRRKYLKWLLFGLLIAGIIITSIFTFGIPAMVAGAITIGGLAGSSGLAATIIGFTAMSVITLGISALIVNVTDVLKGIFNGVKGAYNKITGRSVGKETIDVSKDVSNDKSKEQVEEKTPLDSPSTIVVAEGLKLSLPSLSENKKPAEPKEFESPLEMKAPSVSDPVEQQISYIERMQKNFYALSLGLFLNFDTSELLKKTDKIVVHFLEAEPSKEKQDYKPTDYIFYKKNDEWHCMRFIETKETEVIVLTPDDQLILKNLDKKIIEAKQDSTEFMSFKSERIEITKDILKRDIIPHSRSNDLIGRHITHQISSDICNATSDQDKIFIAERWIAIMYLCYKEKDYQSTNLILEGIKTAIPSRQLDNFKQNLSSDSLKNFNMIQNFCDPSISSGARNKRLNLYQQNGGIPIVPDMLGRVENIVTQIEDEKKRTNSPPQEIVEKAAKLKLTQEEPIETKQDLYKIITRPIKEKLLHKTPNPQNPYDFYKNLKNILSSEKDLRLKVKQQSFASSIGLSEQNKNKIKDMWKSIKPNLFSFKPSKPRTKISK